MKPQVGEIFKKLDGKKRVGEPVEVYEAGEIYIRYKFISDGKKDYCHAPAWHLHFGRIDVKV